MKIKPNRNYKLLGTSVTLDKDTVYYADKATNQPEYEEEGKIFVRDDWDFGFLLVRGEYSIIEA